MDTTSTQSFCEYCESAAAVNLGELWLCEPHQTALREYVGGLEALLELAPEHRRSLADAILPRFVREAVFPEGQPAT